MKARFYGRRSADPDLRHPPRQELQPSAPDDTVDGHDAPGAGLAAQDDRVVVNDYAVGGGFADIGVLLAERDPVTPGLGDHRVFVELLSSGSGEGLRRYTRAHSDASSPARTELRQRVKCSPHLGVLSKSERLLVVAAGSVELPGSLLN